MNSLALSEASPGSIHLERAKKFIAKLRRSEANGVAIEPTRSFRREPKNKGQGAQQQLQTSIQKTVDTSVPQAPSLQTKQNGEHIS